MSTKYFVLQNILKNWTLPHTYKIFNFFVEQNVSNVVP